MVCWPWHPMPPTTHLANTPLRDPSDQWCIHVVYVWHATCAHPGCIDISGPLRYLFRPGRSIRRLRFHNSRIRLVQTKLSATGHAANGQPISLSLDYNTCGRHSVTRCFFRCMAASLHPTVYRNRERNTYGTAQYAWAATHELEAA